MIQALPETRPDEAPEDAWREGCAFASTVEDHELLDPTLSGERLLYRLFHERGIRVYETQTVQEACKCSNSSVFNILKNFKTEERADMVGEDGKISVTCEFCSTQRVFDPSDFEN